MFVLVVLTYANPFTHLYRDGKREKTHKGRLDDICTNMALLEAR